MSSLAGKVALVTGAASGIGEATVKLLLERGAAVLATDIDAVGLERLKAGSDGRLITQVCDVTRESDIADAVARAVSELGRLDIIHSNAARGLEADTTVTESPDDVWLETFSMIVMASVWLCRHGIPAMRATGGGAIVNMSSGAARAATGSKVAYGTAKGALESLTRYTAAVHGHENIRCNTVAPGLVLTGATRGILDPAMFERLAAGNAVGRVCTAEEVAQVVVFLASDDASYVNGEVVTVNGGGPRPVAW